MFETSQDLLNLALAIGFSFISIFLSIALFYAIFVLRDISEATQIVKVTAKKANAAIVEPAKIAAMLFSRAKDVMAVVEKVMTKKRGRK